MPKLPAKTVKAPSINFDSPFRPTTPRPLELVTETTTASAHDMNVSTIGADAAATSGLQTRNADESNAQTDSVVTDVLCHRLSVRFTDAQWNALQDLCRRRRMETGENATVAEVVRDLVARMCPRTAP